MTVSSLGPAYDALVDMGYSLGVKAPRRIPDTAINPDGVVMRRLEREGTQGIAAALDEQRRAIFSGVTEAELATIVARLEDEAIRRPFFTRMLQLVSGWALAGAELGQEQVTVAAGGMAFDWELANTAASEWARNHAARLVTNIDSTTRQRLQTEIARFLEDDETLNQFIQRLRKVGPFSETRAELIAVTEVTEAHAQGNLVSWRESGVIEGKQWNTANDELVCPLCGPLDGQTAQVNGSFSDGTEAPPRHPRCRCWITPVVIGDLETGPEIFERLNLPRFANV